MLNLAPPVLIVEGPGDEGAPLSDEEDPGEADPNPSERERFLAFLFPFPIDDGGGGAVAHDSEGVRAAVEA